jgi:hypothetical protein
MEPVVHENAAAAKRLADLDLTAADLIGALIGADQEARTWTPLAPPMAEDDPVPRQPRSDPGRAVARPRH